MRYGRYDFIVNYLLASDEMKPGKGEIMADGIEITIRIFGTWRLKIVTYLFRVVCRVAAALNGFGDRRGNGQAIAFNLRVTLDQSKQRAK